MSTNLPTPEPPHGPVNPAGMTPVAPPTQARKSGRGKKALVATVAVVGGFIGVSAIANMTSDNDTTNAVEPPTSFMTQDAATADPVAVTPDKSAVEPASAAATPEPEVTTEIPVETTPAPAETTAEPELTLGQRNAIGSAESYLNFMAFSRTGLIEQLEYEGYDTADATFAVDSLAVDWNQQAAEKAESYLELMSFSRQSLIDQLIFEGFTAEEAEYGATAVGY